MSKNISKEDLLNAIEEDLSAYEIATKFKTCAKTIYNKLDFFGLRSQYESKKEKHHALIKDLARFAAIKLLSNIVKKVSQKANNQLRPPEINFITAILKADGLIESLEDGDDSQISKLTSLLENKRNELNIEDKSKTNEQITIETKEFLENSNEEDIDNGT